jgi:hypothetical protein
MLPSMDAPRLDLSDVNEVGTARVRVDASTADPNCQCYFEAIDSNLRAELGMIEVRRDAVRYLIALYKALGGGWTVESGVSSAPGKGASS